MFQPGFYPPPIQDTDFGFQIFDTEINPVLKEGDLVTSWAEYEGDRVGALMPGRDNADYNVGLGLDAAECDLFTYYLLGRGFTIELNNAQEIEGENRLAVLWPDEIMRLDLIRARTVGGVTGLAVVKTLPGRVVVLDSQNIDIYHEPSDPTVITRVCQRWADVDTEGNQHNYRQTHRPVRAAPIKGATFGEIVKWTIIEHELHESGQISVTKPEWDWRYKSCQLVWCQNLPALSTWGAKDGKNSKGIVSALERLAALSMKSVWLHADPIEVTFGLSSSGRIGEDGTPELSEQEMYDRRSTGTAIHLENKEEQDILVREITGGGLATALEYFDKQMLLWHFVTGIPDANSQAQVGVKSGAALEMEYPALVARLAAMRLTYGGFVRRIVQHLREYDGDPAWHDPVGITWPTLFPVSALDAIAEAKGKIELGASQDTGMRIAGLDPKIEAEKKTQEAPATPVAPAPPAGGASMASLMARLGVPKQPVAPDATNGAT